VSNSIRGYAAEFGLTAATGLDKIEPLLGRIAADGQVPELARELFGDYARDYARLEAQIRAIEIKLMAWHRGNELSRRLTKIPGVGPVVASMLVMKTPDPKAFRSLPALRSLDRPDAQGPLHRGQDAPGRDHAGRRRGLA
jgi:Transposase and inactivated derivatives